MQHFLAVVTALWAGPGEAIPVFVGPSPESAIRVPELRIAGNDLARLGIFTDAENGIPPTLKELDTDSGFQDVLVTVQEAPSGSLMFGAGINSNAGLVK